MDIMKELKTTTRPINLTQKKEELLNMTFSDYLDMS